MRPYGFRKSLHPMVDFIQPAAGIERQMARSSVAPFIPSSSNPLMTSIPSPTTVSPGNKPRSTNECPLWSPLFARTTPADDLPSYGIPWPLPAPLPTCIPIPLPDCISLPLPLLSFLPRCTENSAATSSRTSKHSSLTTSHHATTSPSVSACSSTCSRPNGCSSLPGSCTFPWSTSTSSSSLVTTTPDSPSPSHKTTLTKTTTSSSSHTSTSPSTPLTTSSSTSTSSLRGQGRPTTDATSAINGTSPHTSTSSSYSSSVTSSSSRSSSAPITSFPTPASTPNRTPPTTNQVSPATPTGALTSTGTVELVVGSSVGGIAVIAVIAYFLLRWIRNRQVTESTIGEKYQVVPGPPFSHSGARPAPSVMSLVPPDHTHSIIMSPSSSLRSSSPPPWDAWPTPPGSASLGSFRSGSPFALDEHTASRALLSESPLISSFGPYISSRSQSTTPANNTPGYLTPDLDPFADTPRPVPGPSAARLVPGPFARFGAVVEDVEGFYPSGTFGVHSHNDVDAARPHVTSRGAVEASGDISINDIVEYAASVVTTSEELPPYPRSRKSTATTRSRF
ncbi:hypothetical protein CONPUDRAFT_83683 [Coniophora puteana RWD-64-598 SS2]|uniref:Uncharacterized protein n=1 Tax=Coniophora puteana (strain RWD-64-598) TaxID=741705 RepID=A0A5M3MGP4_CONPW|nr:uncharacterized protein CONPUDRAFT_83683 [Coniophora puteana RWD-64-598 SS2]EIW78166.1 hypothetical protein CONPUDRAFT_83683 [Coniophora puteana RWD-64-598 SS2]